MRHTSMGLAEPDAGQIRPIRGLRQAGRQAPSQSSPAPASSSGRRRRSGGLDRFAGSLWALIPTFGLALAIRLIHLDQMNGYEDFRTPILDEAWSWDLASRFMAGFGSVGRPFDADPGAALLVSLLVRSSVRARILSWPAWPSWDR
jgi:hypothetical protein